MEQDTCWTVFTARKTQGLLTRDVNVAVTCTGKVLPGSVSDGRSHSRLAPAASRHHKDGFAWWLQIVKSNSWMSRKRQEENELQAAAICQIRACAVQAHVKLAHSRSWLPASR
jgi:hypothetical protein